MKVLLIFEQNEELRWSVCSGAAECVGNTLRHLCGKLSSSADAKARALPRDWLKALLLLLLPRPEAEDENEGDAALERNARIRCMIDRLKMQSSDGADLALPPPLRKSATFGFALVAILEGEFFGQLFLSFFFSLCLSHPWD